MTTKRRIYGQITGQGGATTVMWVAEEKQELDAPGEVFPKGTANC